MPRGMLMAARAGNRMQARQSYRTINRMERRRALVHEAFGGGGERPVAPEDQERLAYAPPPPAPPPAPPQGATSGVPSYVEELEHLARLHADGVVTDEEYDAKKRQVLGL